MKFLPGFPVKPGMTWRKYAYHNCILIAVYNICSICHRKIYNKIKASDAINSNIILGYQQSINLNPNFSYNDLLILK